MCCSLTLGVRQTVVQQTGTFSVGRSDAMIDGTDQTRRALSPVVVMMGVSGVGKTTIGKALAAKLDWSFVDGDDLHPPSNVLKMERGEPLDDRDRQPWLSELHRVIEDHRRQRNATRVVLLRIEGFVSASTRG